MKLKIFLALDSRNFGGIESHVEQLAWTLKQHQQDVTVLFLQNYGTHPMIARLQKKALAFVFLDGSVCALWRFVRAQRPDVVHTHGYKAGILLRLICRLLNVRCVSTFHSGEQKQGKLKYYDFFDRYSAFLAQKVYAVNQDILRALPCRAQLLNNFVSLPLQMSCGKQIAFVGRLSAEKAPERFAQLAASFPQHTFHLYGDGPLRQELQANAPANFVLHGARADMENVWPQIGILILPSKQEGLPMAALEAMAHAIPVAAFAVGGLSALIEHGRNGWLLAENDLPALAHALQIWLDGSDAQRQQWQIAARETVAQRFCAQQILPTLLESYRGQ
ncbi:MAG: glycosyltransferase family 4 protein [Vibrionaceae bacterium]